MIRFTRSLSLLCFCLCCLLAIGSPRQPAVAQDSLAIAAVVNDDVITVLDLSVRTRMVIVSARLEDSPETRTRLASQVLRGLIDERLKLQEAELNGISVPQAAIDERVAQLAAQNNMSVDQFRQVLERNGILVDTLTDQIRAEIAWATLIQRKLQPTVVISEEEVDEALAELQANLGKPEYRVAEIYLATDSTTSEEEVRQTAQRLVDQLRQGGDFESLARQFSQSASAANGGDLGWVRPGQLDSDFDAALADLQPGAVAGPLRTAGGYHIIKMLDRRQTGSTSELDGRVSMKQVFIPVAEGASPAETEEAAATARSVTAQARSCDDMVRLSKEINPEANTDLDDLRIGDLPDVLRPVALEQELGTPSDPVHVETGIGIFMVCERHLPETGLPSRQEISQSLMRERLDILARGYLRDLRRAAFVDVRV